MVVAIFNANETYKAVHGLWQWDYGQVLRIQGLPLPSAVEIHFSLQETGGEAVTRVGVTKDSVTDVVIPDSMMENEGAVRDYKIYVFVYLSDGVSGRTEYKIQMTVRARPKPYEFQAPGDAELFREAIQAVNESADRAEEAANFAEALVHGREDYPERAEDNAAYYVMKAADSQMAAEKATEKGEEARASAEKALSEALEAALQAEDSAGRAAGYTENAIRSAGNALASEQAAETARAEAGIAAEQARLYAEQSLADSDTVKEAETLMVEIGREISDNRTVVEQMVDAFGTTVKEAVMTINETGTNQTEMVQREGEVQIAAVRKEAEGIMLANDQIQENAENISRLSEMKADLEILRRVILEKETQVKQTHVLTDSAEFPVMGMCVYGRTTQDGAPTPENPIEFVSTGDKGNIEADVVGKNLLNIPYISAESEDTEIVVHIAQNATISFGNDYEVSEKVWRFRFTYKSGKNVYVFDGDSAVTLPATPEDPIVKIFYRGTRIISGSATNIQLEYGDTATSYSPYSLQTLTLATPNGLPGIPVSSGGNYTDENGQQWIADYRDWERGMDVQCTKEITGIVFRLHPGYELENSELFVSDAKVNDIDIEYNKMCCWSDHMPYKSVVATNELGFYILRNYVYARVPSVSDADTFNNLMENVKFIVPIHPTETPIPEGELAAYRALHTNSPITVVTADAPIRFTYAADIGRHIEKNYVQKASYMALEERVAALEVAAVNNI